MKYVVDLDKGADGEILSPFLFMFQGLMLMRKFRKVGIYEGDFIQIYLM